MSEMKVIGYMPLLYGKEYLKESLSSVIDLVDKFVILYTPRASYGHGVQHQCPESEEELKEIAQEVCGDKLIWSSKRYHNEGEHRNEIYKYSDGYDIIITVDADEVVDTEEMRKAIEVAHEGEYRNYGIDGYINLWRSFDKACFDGFRPIRIINPKGEGQGEVKVTIWHFSCCQAKETMEYKYLTHGHSNELRTNWLQDFFYSGRTEDVHPVAIGLWNVVDYDKTQMPDILKKHKNYGKE